jgi:hypothetical protein
MLGATQAVDMISSLKKDYARVEVAVLSVDLLPNLIDTMVIGDRMFSLPIQVEGRYDNVERQYNSWTWTMVTMVHLMGKTMLI